MMIRRVIFRMIIMMKRKMIIMMIRKVQLNDQVDGRLQLGIHNVHTPPLALLLIQNFYELR